MYKGYSIRVLIPAFNEENAIGQVLNDIPAYADEVIVTNNASTDRTEETARGHGATVVTESAQGYGRACLKGIEILNSQHPDTDIVVFIDADYSDYPEEMTTLLNELITANVDLVIGSRALGEKELGSMTFPQVFGNWLATRLLRLFYGAKFTDLGPFRAIWLNSLNRLQMEDPTYGWTVEMQLKVAKYGLKYSEIPVNYRNRIGKSKISGTIKGTILAGYKIIITIFKYL